jgi:hypothetical protein
MSNEKRPMNNKKMRLEKMQEGIGATAQVVGFNGPRFNPAASGPILSQKIPNR